MRAKAIIAGAAIVALTGLAACGGEEKETAAVAAAELAELREQADKRDAEYEAQPQVAREDARAAERRAVKRAERRAAKRAAAKAERRAAEEAAVAAGTTVPNVVGMDHQLAQDTMQAAGFYYLVEEDCTGQGRLLLWDRNWTVQEQTPAGGSSASVDEDVTLCSVQDGE